MISVIDSHVHFWDPAVLSYPWLRGLPAIDRAFLPAAYEARVDGMVVVEANCAPPDTLREARWFESLAASDPRISAIVGFVGLDHAADDALDRLAAIPRVKGVRHNIQGESPGFCLQPLFVDGVRAVGRRGLGFDLCAMHDQLADVVELVTRCPDTRFVLDHCGKPAIRENAREPWMSDIRRLAERPNVWCKLSGLLTEAAPRCADDDLAPYAAHVVDAFGVDRVMYGSDWPVLTLAGTHADWFAFTNRFTSDWTATERRALYSENASRFYRTNHHVGGPPMAKSGHGLYGD